MQVESVKKKRGGGIWWVDLVDRLNYVFSSYNVVIYI